MASSLAAQLAKIKATGPNPLDLKAQKSAHSQSLLFDSQTAATQDFDTLFLLCFKGFEELCNLDARFTDFVHNVFSEQSKHEDRNQMTALQNSQLDVVLEHFLALVGGKLLLKPAQKAVEWLIRRFRVHQNNTLCLVLTFLPYYASPIFTTLLSILPQNLPATLRFLYPYIKSQASPPRRVLVYAATNNVAFLARFNARVLAVCKSGHHYPALVSFWASIFAEAVAALIDLSRSGRQEAQMQRREDLMYRIIPTLSEGLNMSKAPDLQVGCYMVLTVATSKLRINDKTFTAFMNMVALNLSKTKETGMIFLAALSQQMDVIKLPEQVLKSLLTMEGLIETLITLHRQYRLDCVALGIVLGILQDRTALDIHRLGLISSLVTPNLMYHSYIKIAAIALISALQKPFQDIALKKSIENLLQKLFEDKNLVANVRDALKNTTEEVAQLEPEIQKIIHAEHKGSLLSGYDKDMKNIMSTEKAYTFNDAIGQIPMTKENENGFLSRQASPLFDTLAKTFMIAYPSEHNLKVFSELGILHKSEASNEPLFLSFYIRFWCGSHPPRYRTAAIKSFSAQVKDDIRSTSLQLVIPYVLYGLSDSSSEVRQASIELVRLLRNAHSGKEKVDSNTPLEETGGGKIYGQDKSAHSLIWLLREEACKFMDIILLSRIEECLLDPEFISQLLFDVLSDSNHCKNPHTGNKELKTGIRRKFFAYMSSHVVNTPLYAVKLRLLGMLNRIEQAGKLSRTKALLPLISESIRWNHSYFVDICSHEMIDQSEFLHQIFRIVQPNDRNGIQILHDTIKSEHWKSSSYVLTAAYERVSNIWGSLRSDLQSSLATTILERAVSDEPSRISEEDYQALITLRTVPLSTTVLQSLLESCISFASSLSAIPLASKRRKISHGPTVNSDHSSAIGAVLPMRRLTLVLELIEACGPTKHSQLLKGLFQVLEQLQLHRNISGTDMVYIQVLVMENVLAILGAFKKSLPLQIDHSTFQTSLIVESVRTTTSTQVQQVGLLILSTLAHVTPKLVLHSVIPIFTFMNETILRQSDDYSAYVVNQIMESVIPVLAKSLKEQEKDPIHGISELLLSFVAAFDHIPSQRRLGLFKSLTDKIGSVEFLFVVPIVFSDKYPGNEQIMQFITSLVRRYDIKTQFNCIEKYLGVILDISKTTHGFSKYSVAISEERDFSSVVAKYLPFVAIFLESPDLSLKLRHCFHQKDNSNIGEPYERIMNHLFLLSDIIRNYQSRNKLIDQILESLLNLISISNLTEILKNFLERAQDDIRCQVLKSFQQRLNNRSVDHKMAQNACVGLLPLLTSIIQSTTHSSLKHACLSVMNNIIRKYGKTNVATVEIASDIVSSDDVLGAPEVELRITFLNCLASMIEVLRDGIIPILPTLIPKALDQVNNSIRRDAESRDLFEAAFSLFHVLLSYMPWAVSNLHLERFLTVSYKSVNSQLEKGCYQQCLKTLRLAAIRAEPQGFLRALDVTWISALQEGSTAIGTHLELLRTTIERQPKSSIAKHHPILADILVKAFDIRNMRFSLDTGILRESEIEEIENAIIDSAIAIVYKLNDTTFRPMFLKVWEWTGSTSYKSNNAVWFHRKTTFYAFVARFFQSFRSIVTSYAAFIIGDSVNILNDIPIKDDESVILWKQVVLSLCEAFKHDQDDFWQSPSHFSPAADSLLAQFNHASLLPMTSEIIPAITELAASANSIDHLKELNSAILKHMRSEDAYIRLAAVQCECSLTARLGEEWLKNLPEMLPFINELQEDDDESVSTELRHWIVKVESILGESVNSMLR